MISKKYLKGIGFFISLILIDQVSKYLVRHFDGFYICNPGISFGIKLPEFLFWILWILIISALIYSILKSSSSINFYLLFFVLAGAVSNIIDRLYFECVLDFIDLKVWPIFNLADTFISLGAIAIIIMILKTNSHNSKKIVF